MVAHPEGLLLSFHIIGTPTLALHEVIKRLFANFFVALIVYPFTSHISLFDNWPIEQSFSNSLIIYVALTQPEHHILVRWMGLETQ